MQLEPPAKKAKFSKSRVETTGKSVAKQSKNASHSVQSAAAAAGTSSSDCTDSNAVASSSGISQKHKNAVEKVIVERPVYNGDIRSGQYVPQWDPYVMVETVSNVRLFSNIDSEAYMTPHVHITNSGVSSLRMANVTSLPTMYENKHTSMSKGESSEQSVKAKGCSKKGTIPHSHSGKEKGPQKPKTLTSKGKRNYQRNKDGDISSSQCSNPVADNKDVSKQTKSFSKQMTRTTSSGRGESSRQKRQYGEESSRPHCSHRTWPTIPNLDYASGKRFQVTYNDETVFISQYKLLK